VEEEFLLLDPASGRPVPASPAALRLLADRPGLQPELMRFQLETTTAVCRHLPELRTELARLRRLAAAGAEAVGCRLVASGISPYGTRGLIALTDTPRYRELARRYPLLTARFGTCGRHVHVAVPSRDSGVQVLARLRPWLATLLAVSANSPIEGGRDTGWASCRYPVVSRWPTARPPAVWPDAAHYDAAVKRLIRRGAAMDQRSIYFLARLSPRYPTVEIRISDVCSDIDTALLCAALARALVMTCLTETETSAPLPATDRETVRTELIAAARDSLAGVGLDPFTGEPAVQRHMLDRLLTYVHSALTATGDDRAVERLLTLLDFRGTGADRQRRHWACANSPAEFVEALAETTITEPADLPASARGAPERRRSTHRPGDRMPCWLSDRA
jgi:carboxylate-amine ligase